MDVLFSPWRYEYLTSGEKSPESFCVFCDLPAEDERTDAEKLIVHRARHNYIVLNKFPYISGHLLIVPFSHVSDLDRADKETTDELMDLTKRCQTVLRAAYNPQGFNLGMNLGKAAGAGVAGHIHLHIMPRWFGDTNFTTTVGETRVIPEDLATTYGKLRDKF
jgi:ATP adenylyltransferase